MTDLALSDSKERVLTTALAGLSPNTCRVYRRHLLDFLAQCPILDREHVLRYMGSIHDTSAYNQALSAVKRLAMQSAANGWISYPIAIAVESLPAKRLLGTRSGNWLTLEQARALLLAPDATSLSGKRDRAVLALLVGCGLRRDELSRLSYDQIQSRAGKALITNLMGKGNRVRTVAIPDWAHFIVMSWLRSADIRSGTVLRSFTPVGAVNGRLSVSGIWDIVIKYSTAIGITCAPHDLRRTYAKLARTNGAPIEVIQHSLGHSNLVTTQRYMNTGEEANAGDYFTL